MHEAPTATPRRAIPPVVGIGASAGRVVALRRFFRAVRPGCRMAFLVVRHAGHGEGDALEALLGPVCSLPVARITNDAAIEPGRVYDVPRNASLTIINGWFRTGDRFSRGDHRGPIDALLGRLALDRGENTAGVVLSSGGRGDGAFGLRAIRENGGIACAETGSDHDGAMRGGVARGPVDFVLDAEAMPARIEDYFRRKARAGRRDAAGGAHLPAILAALRAETGHDFGGYEKDAIAKRVRRRMDVLTIDDPERFVERLRREPREARLLFQDILVSVTNFFREPPAFAALAHDVVPHLFEGKGPDDTIRVWVPGCATGEEAYSLAMLLDERMTGVPHPPEVRIVATDIKESALAIARAGLYPASIARDVPAVRLKRCFTRKGGGWQVSDRLRERCLFSEHDLLGDAPLCGFDLISCRNLLVHLGAPLRHRVLAAFHEALVADGFLFLGAPDDVAPDAPLLATVDGPHRIFRRRDRPAGAGGAASLSPRFACIAARSDVTSGTR